MIPLTSSDRSATVPEPELDTSPDRRAWPPGGLPIVFQRPPSHYAVAKTEQLSEWERVTTEMLGLGVERGTTEAFGLETVSFCGNKPDGHPNPCDSDFFPTTLEA
jgi:hypothetical protein